MFISLGKYMNNNTNEVVTSYNPNLVESESDIKTQDNSFSKSDPQQSASSGPISIDTIKQLLDGLSKASESGVTQLPNRDIGNSTQQMMIDEEVKPNYVPKPDKHVKFINEDEGEDEAEDEEDYMIEQSYKNDKSRTSSVNHVYSQIHIPIILAVIYFIFQLSGLKHFLFTNFQMLFTESGNYNTYGLVVMSSLFGALYFAIMAVIDQCAEYCE